MKRISIFCTILFVFVIGCGTSVDHNAETEELPAFDVDLNDSDQASTTEENENSFEEQGSVINIDWKQAYAEYLDSLDEEANCALLYINDDTIPELIIKDKAVVTCGVDGIDVLVFENASCSFHERENLIKLIEENKESEMCYENIYEISEGMWTIVHSGEIFDRYYATLFVDETKCKWDGNDISAQEYIYETEKSFPLEDSCSYLSGFSPAELHKYLNNDNKISYKERFKETIETGMFHVPWSNLAYNKYAIMNVGNDESVELIGYIKKDLNNGIYENSCSIITYWNGILSIPYSLNVDSLSVNNALLDIYNGTVYTCSVFPRWNGYDFIKIENGTILNIYSVENYWAPGVSEEEEPDSIESNEEENGDSIYINGIPTNIEVWEKLYKDISDVRSSNLASLNEESLYTSDKFTPELYDCITFTELNEALDEGVIIKQSE